MLRVSIWFILVAGVALGQAQPDAGVRKVLTDQVAAWNRGDIVAFMQGYENSAETTFIGKTVQHGWQQVLDNYKARYATRAAMGVLDFSDIAVRMLGTGYASVTGKFHLARGKEGGGDAAGVFSLVFRKESGGEWRIILDHTS